MSETSRLTAWLMRRPPLMPSPREQGTPAAREERCPECEGGIVWHDLPEGGQCHGCPCQACHGSDRASSSPVSVDRDECWLDELAREFDFAFTAAPEPTDDDAWADFRAGIKRILPLIVKAERERLKARIEGLRNEYPDYEEGASFNAGLDAALALLDKEAADG